MGPIRTIGGPATGCVRADRYSLFSFHLPLHRHSLDPERRQQPFLSGGRDIQGPALFDPFHPFHFKASFGDRGSDGACDMIAALAPIEAGTTESTAAPA